MNLASNLLDSASAHADRVVLRLGEAALRDHVKRQVAAYKYPRKVWIVQALPKTATGKILKREIVPPAGLDQR